MLFQMEKTRKQWKLSIFPRDDPPWVKAREGGDQTQTPVRRPTAVYQLTSGHMSSPTLQQHSTSHHIYPVRSQLLHNPWMPLYSQIYQIMSGNILWSFPAGSVMDAFLIFWEEFQAHFIVFPILLHKRLNLRSQDFTERF